MYLVIIEKYSQRNDFSGSQMFLNPAGIYLLKVNNKNTRARCEICSKSTIKTPERRHWRRSGIFTVNSEHVIASREKTVLKTLACFTGKHVPENDQKEQKFQENLIISL